MTDSKTLLTKAPVHQKKKKKKKAGNYICSKYISENTKQCLHDVFCYVDFWKIFLSVMMLLRKFAKICRWAPRLKVGQ